MPIVLIVAVVFMVLAALTAAGVPTRLSVSDWLLAAIATMIVFGRFG